jgi:catechol 2,3-dioxygenase-like lactoylglutathione lyase family enzyme
MKAEHITLVPLKGSASRSSCAFDPPPSQAPGEEPTNRHHRGFNHLAFRVDDIEATTAHLVSHGVTLLSNQMNYISRKLRFFEGPEAITLELVEWVEPES